jgi:CheY-like chemotaxis protein
VDGISEASDAMDAQAQPPGGTETVVLVEDDAEVRALTKEILEACGYTVLPARRPGDAIQLVQGYEGPIDLLLTDVVMPHMSGRRLSEHLLQLRSTMRVLFMSGYTDDAISHHGVLDSGIPFLQKPFTPDALARKIREVLSLVNENVVGTAT